MSRPNAPENFFSAVRGCPRPCARTNPWFRGQIFGESVRKNRPLVPRSNIAGSWTRGGGGYAKLNEHPFCCVQCITTTSLALAIAIDTRVVECVLRRQERSVWPKGQTGPSWHHVRSNNNNYKSLPYSMRSLPCSGNTVQGSESLGSGTLLEIYLENVTVLGKWRKMGEISSPFS